MADHSTALKMNDREMSDKAKPLLAAVVRDIHENVDLIVNQYFRLRKSHLDRWTFAPGQLELIKSARQKARYLSLWNSFQPNAETGEAQSNLEYTYIAYIAAEIGKNPLASENPNCSARVTLDGNDWAINGGNTTFPGPVTPRSICITTLSPAPKFRRLGPPVPLRRLGHAV